MRRLQMIGYLILCVWKTAPKVCAQALQMAAERKLLASRRPHGRLIGYARVSTDMPGYRNAGDRAARRRLRHHHPGARLRRFPCPPCPLQASREVSAGDTLVVVRLDRLARSVSYLLEVSEDLTARKAHFRSLQDPIDTTTWKALRRLLIAVWPRILWPRSMNATCRSSLIMPRRR